MPVDGRIEGPARRRRARCHHGGGDECRTRRPRAGGRRARGPGARRRWPPLARLAYNYRWSWTPGRPRAVLRRRSRRAGSAAGRTRCGCSARPTPRALERAAADAALLERIAAVEAAVRADLARPPAEAPVPPEHPVAYFCAEFGVHRSLPIYSGGLGALAGDILKEVSDRALPFVAVGLMYRQGYFRQRIDAGGWQHEYWVDTDPERLPAALVTGADGEPLTITVPVRDMTVIAQIWRVDVGRVAALPARHRAAGERPAARWITSRLYIGEPDARLAQYVLLGVGGDPRARRAGHRARARAPQRGPRGVHLARARAPTAARSRRARRRAPHDLHDPHAGPGRQRHVPARAGRSRRSPGSRRERGVDSDELIRLGRTRPDDEGEPFGVSQFALRTSRAANGVSRRHGEVARDMWKDLWPGTRARRRADRPRHERRPPADLARAARCASCSTATSATAGSTRAADPATWAPVDDIPDEDLWAVRSRAARRVRRVRARQERLRPARARRAARLRRGRRDARSTRTR